MRPVKWGTDHHRSMKKCYPHFIPMGLMGEDLPEESNRVELDPEVIDSSGIPAPRITYTYSENSLRMLEHGVAMARHLFEAAGALEFFDGGISASAYHLMGTARMGNDPKTSVVNAKHQAHDVKNLFIVDGSSFTTCASVNPTSTIGALALRCANGIWERRQEWN